LLDHLIGLILIHGPWIIFGIVALESMGVPLPGETTLVGAALLANSSDQLDIVTIVAAAIGGAIVGDSIGYAVGRSAGLPLLQKYGHRIRLDDGRLLIGRYLFLRYGGAVVFFGRFIALLRMFAGPLAGAGGMPWWRFLLFNIAGGICWACTFGFGAYAVGAEVHRISGALSAVAFVLFVAAGLTFSRVLRRYEPVLLRRAQKVFATRP
jgi:membrane protein DedA with SNARE-associated domain